MSAGLQLETGTLGNAVAVSAANPIPVTSSGAGAASDRVQGAGPSGATAVGDPVAIAGLVSTGAPATAVTGQRSDVWVSANGALISALPASAGSDGSSNTYRVVPSTTSSVGGNLGVNPSFFNGTTWDRARIPSAVTRLLTSAATTNATAVKSATGWLFKVVGYNTVATKRYLKIYNLAVAPTVGTSVPFLTLPLLPSAGFSFSFETPLYFAAGISFAITGGVGDADATAVAAGDIEAVNVVYS